MTETVKIGAGDAVQTQADEGYDAGCTQDAHFWEADRPDDSDLCECKDWTWGEWKRRTRR
jgi:hypothetical protein